MRAMDGAVRRVLMKAGAFVRKSAKDSIRKRKKPAPPGKPPSSHVGTLKRFILFAYDQRRRSVIIGPKKLKPGTATVALEKGGRSTMLRWRRGRRKTVRIRVAKRPFMAPALEKESRKIAELFKDQIGKRGTPS